MKIVSSILILSLLFSLTFASFKETKRSGKLTKRGIVENPAATKLPVIQKEGGACPPSGSLSAAKTTSYETKKSCSIPNDDDLTISYSCFMVGTTAVLTMDYATTTGTGDLYDGPIFISGFSWAEDATATFSPAPQFMTRDITCTSDYCSNGKITTNCQTNNAQTFAAATYPDSYIGFIVRIGSVAYPDLCKDGSTCCADTKSACPEVELAYFNPDSPTIGGSDFIGPYGVPSISTAGQLFTPPAGAVALKFISVWAKSITACTLTSKLYVYEWDTGNNRPTASALYESAPISGSVNSFINYNVTFDPPVNVDTSKQYISFISTVGISQGNCQFQLAAKGPVNGSPQVYYLNAANTGQWTTSAWTALPNTLIFKAVFSSPGA